MRYTNEFKDSIIRRILPPNNESIAEISREEGIPTSTIHDWVEKARSKGIPVPKVGEPAEDWSTRDKFLIVLETASLNETELAEYCRKKGLYVDQVKQWADNCMNANGGVAKEATRLQQELKAVTAEKKLLEKEVMRKDKALAETAALLVLSKKANAIWGTDAKDE